MEIDYTGHNSINDVRDDHINRVDIPVEISLALKRVSVNIRPKMNSDQR